LTDDLSWSDDIRKNIGAFDDMQKYVLEIFTNLQNRQPLIDGEMIFGDDISHQVEKMFGPKGTQTEQLLKYGGPLAKTAGLQGDRLGLTDAVNESAEDGNTESGNWHGGKY
jgi:hypothetical protein